MDLRGHYFRQRRHLFSLCIILLAISICRDFILDPAWPIPLNLGFQLFFIAFAATGIIFAQEWYHKLAVVAVAMIFIGYVVALFTRLQ